jgi:AcrR family transcriptional regulator
VADIVDHSAASFGSIYHHFGGKKQLFLAIFDRLAADIDRCIEATADRVAALDRQQTFEANARAHLKPIWQTGAPRWCWLPATTRPASTGPAPQHAQGPPPLDVGARARQFAAGQLLTRILIAVMAEASGMVIMCEDPTDVGPITDATIEWIGRLTS